MNRLIDLTGATVSVPLYPLAPEHQYDTTLPMVSAAYESTVGMEAPQDQMLALERDVALDYEEHEGMFHGWMLQNIPEAHHATRRIVRQTCGSVRTSGARGARSLVARGSGYPRGHDQP